MAPGATLAGSQRDGDGEPRSTKLTVPQAREKLEKQLGPNVKLDGYDNPALRRLLDQHQWDLQVVVRELTPKDDAATWTSVQVPSKTKMTRVPEGQKERKPQGGTSSTQSQAQGPSEVPNGHRTEGLRTEGSRPVYPPGSQRFIAVDVDKYPLIVGTRGSTLRDLQTQHNVRIWVPGPEDRNSDVRIRGTLPDIQAAHEAIEKLLNEKLPERGPVSYSVRERRDQQRPAAAPGGGGGQRQTGGGRVNQPARFSGARCDPTRPIAGREASGAGGPVSYVDATRGDATRGDASRSDTSRGEAHPKSPQRVPAAESQRSPHKADSPRKADSPEKAGGEPRTAAAAPHSPPPAEQPLASTPAPAPARPCSPPRLPCPSLPRPVHADPRRIRRSPAAERALLASINSDSLFDDTRDVLDTADDQPAPPPLVDPPDTPVAVPESRDGLDSPPALVASATPGPEDRQGRGDLPSWTRASPPPEPPVAPPPISRFAVGDHVQVRMRENQEWASGTITGHDAKGRPYVRAEKMCFACQFVFVEPLPRGGRVPCSAATLAEMLTAVEQVPEEPPSPPAEPEPVEPTEADKLRGAYAALDPARTGAVSLAGWLAALRAYRITIPEDHARRLFERATHGAPTLTFADFRQYMDELPSLLDVLYHRSCSPPEAAALGGGGHKLQALRAAKAALADRARQAQREIDNQEAKLRVHQENIACALQREQCCTDQQAAVEAEEKRHRSGVAEAQQQCSQARERQGEARSRRQKAADQVAATTEKLRQYTEETAQARGELRELELRLERMRKDLERLSERDDAVVRALDLDKRALKEAESEELRIQQMMRSASTCVDSAEDDMKRLQAKRQDWETQRRQAVEDRRHLELQRDYEKAALDSRRQELRSLAEEEARCDEQLRSLREQGAAESHQLAERQRADEEQDNEFLCNAVRLRISRYDIEREEEELRARRRARGP
eukprot:TRINITY_DN24636_c0_g1_i1.p1 TRINITY_DN24636_c0_g1~~TRINITY_DN24636_c0_g1_i1.p1  ORF type:complete len:959 (+),score=223.02 TRINITY_DN24636_c0_g1_i1:106-2982(+)